MQRGGSRRSGHRGLTLRHRAQTGSGESHCLVPAFAPLVEDPEMNVHGIPAVVTVNRNKYGFASRKGRVGARWRFCSQPDDIGIPWQNRPRKTAAPVARVTLPLLRDEGLHLPQKIALAERLIGHSSSVGWFTACPLYCFGRSDFMSI